MSVLFEDPPVKVAPRARANQSPLRIAFLSYRSDPKVGGQGIFVTQAAAALARRGHRVDILSGPPYPDIPDGVDLVRLPSLDLYVKPRGARLRNRTDLGEYVSHITGKFGEPESFGRRAAAYLRTRRDRYDVVLDNQCLADGLLEIERGGLPVVGVIHHPIRRDLEFALAAEPRWGMRIFIRRWYGFLPMQERVARRLKRLIVVSEASRADVGLCMGVSPETLMAIPIGVDREVFRPQPGVTRLANRILTTASADTPLKGLRYLLEAQAQLVRTRPDLELVVVGRPRKGGAVELMERLGLTGKVTFLHDLSRAEMARAYASATLAVTPSLYEGFGLPAAEAMCCGTPVIVTDGGALPEVVGDAGLVVPKANVGALAEAIEALLDDAPRRASMSVKGLARADRVFSWDLMAARYEAILREAVASC